VVLFGERLAYSWLPGSSGIVVLSGDLPVILTIVFIVSVANAVNLVDGLDGLAAGMVAIAAGAYELTPLKRHFRRRCRDSVRSGLEFGLCCAGSSIGLMGMLVALGVMSVIWMCVIAVLVLAQKLLPPQAAIDVPLALAIAGLGVLIVLAPASVPGLTPPM